MWRQRSTYLYVIFFLTGVIFILVGIQLFESSTWRLVLVELGVGALIAVFLGVTVERVANDSFRKEVDAAIERIKQNVFEETLRSMLPESVVSEVLLSVFSQSLIRRNLQLVLSLQRDDRLPGEHAQTLSRNQL